MASRRLGTFSQRALKSFQNSRRCLPSSNYAHAAADDVQRHHCHRDGLQSLHCLTLLHWFDIAAIDAQMIHFHLSRVNALVSYLQS